MLSPHDRNVVASDPDLPALRFLLDDEAALELFQERFPELQPTSAHCTYLRYKPRTSCLAALTLETAQGSRLFYAKAYSQRNFDKIGKAFDRANSLARGNPRTLVFLKLSLVIESFPYDDELPALERLFAGDENQPLLARLVPEQEAFRTASIVTLRYKPERRFVARLDIAGNPAAVLKIHTESRYQQARRAMKSLGPLGGFSIPQLLGHSNRYHSLLLSWLAGTPLASSLNSPQFSSSTWEAVGAALAGLHNLPDRKLPSRSVDDEIREIRQQSKDLRYVSPGLASRLQALTEQCAAVVHESFTAVVPTHGDFHPGQILISGNSVSLIDLDDVTLGQGAYDLGNFVAHLEQAALRGSLPEEQKHRFLAAFLTGYQQQTDETLDHRKTQVCAAAALIRLVHEPFRQRLPDWHNQQEEIVGRVEAMLGESALTSVAPKASRTSPFVPSRSSPAVEVIDPFGARHDVRLPFIREAIDPSLASAAIGHLAQQSCDDDSLQLQSIRIVRHKPGRRCLIAYQFRHGKPSQELTLLGKVHAKSRHEKSYRLQQTLWDNGFDDQSRDGISVARPVGTLGQWNMWLQQYVPGKIGWEALRGPNCDSVATRIADAAHKLHQANYPTDRVHTIDEELQVLEQRLAQVIAQMPSLKSRINAVLVGCRDLASTLSALPSSGIHRDFYPDQILVNNDRIYLLDLDLYCAGHPSLDIGNFCAHLIEKSLRHHDSGTALMKAKRRIIDRFVTLSGEAQRQSVDIYTTLSLARHIQLSTQFATRNSATLPILAACELRLAGASTFGR